MYKYICFLQIATMFAVIWGIGLLGFLFGNIDLLSSYPAYLSPGLVGLLYFGFLINPLPICFHKARLWLLKRLVSRSFVSRIMLLP